MESADAAAEQVRQAGGAVLSEPFDVFDAGRMAVCGDPEGAGARAFYGDVFGWTTLEMEGGFTAWTLPGYGDFLETINPGTRERNAALGAPAGFADVVATLAVLGDDQPDTPAHWGVTFGVENADAAAERAAALGGTVVAGPFDAPWVRTVVIVDPQGATFVASQFVPEQQDTGVAS